jgi:hypothetical protein
MKNGSLGVKQQSFTLTGFALVAVRRKYLQEFPTLIKATPCAMNKWLNRVRDNESQVYFIKSI